MTQSRRSLMQRLYLWHRWIGLTVSVLVLVLAITGLLLNHTDRLRLSDRHMDAAWLLQWYGISPADDIRSFRINDHWISVAGDRLYVGDAPVADVADVPAGVVALDVGFIAVALPDSLLLLQADGTLVERIGSAALPGRIERAGVTANGRLMIATPNGRYVADANLLEWTPSQQAGVWAAPTAAPADLQQRLRSAEQGQGLPVERVLLDLHSGRIFGGRGPLLMDLAAVSFIVLSMTGFANWWWRRRLMRNSRAHHVPNAARAERG